MSLQAEAEPTKCQLSILSGAFFYRDGIVQVGKSSLCPGEGLATDVCRNTLLWYTTEQPVQFVSHFERTRCWFTFLFLTNTQS